MGLTTQQVKVSDDEVAGPASGKPAQDKVRGAGTQKTSTEGIKLYDGTIERAVCAVLMRNVEARRLLSTMVPDPSMLFNAPDTRELARTCVVSGDQMTPADVAIAAKGTYEWQEGYLDDVYFSFTHKMMIQFDEHAALLVAYWQRRQVLEQLEDMTYSLSTNPVTGIVGTITSHAEELNRITRVARASVSPKISDRLKAIVADIESGHVDRLRVTGIRPLDDRIGGIDFDNADFIAIAGQSGAGKTRVAMNIVGNLCSLYGNEAKVCWISTEAGFTPAKIAAGFVAQRATKRLLDEGFSQGITPRDFLGGIYKHDEVLTTVVHDAIAEVSGWGVLLYGPDERDGGAQVLSNSLALAANAIEQHGCNIVVLDNYQQLLDASVKNAANVQYLMLLRAVQELSNLVASKGVVHIGVSQLSSSGDILGGQSLKYMANCVLGVSQTMSNGSPPPMSDEIVLEGIKVREGERFKDVRIAWDKRSGLLRAERGD